MDTIHDLIDRMTEAEYLSMVDMKWVADRLREFSEEQDNRPANADIVQDLSDLTWSNTRPEEEYWKKKVRSMVSKYRPVKVPAGEGLEKMLYKKLYPYPCGEYNNRVRLDGSSLDIWFTKDEVDMIVSSHKASDKGVSR